MQKTQELVPLEYLESSIIQFMNYVICEDQCLF